MQRNMALGIFWVTLLGLGLIAVAEAQQPKGPPPAPIPPQIAAAKKAFIANGGGASFETILEQTVFSGGPDRPYNQLYDAMKSWGRYELVGSPSESDLVFNVRWNLTDTGLKLPVLGELQVEIVDPKTQVTLWAFDEYVRGAILLGNRDKNFDRAMKAIQERMKKLVEAPASGSDPAAK